MKPTDDIVIPPVEAQVPNSAVPGQANKLDASDDESMSIGHSLGREEYSTYPIIPDTSAPQSIANTIGDAGATAANCDTPDVLQRAPMTPTSTAEQGSTSTGGRYIGPLLGVQSQEPVRNAHQGPVLGVHLPAIPSQGPVHNAYPPTPTPPIPPPAFIMALFSATVGSGQLVGLGATMVVPISNFGQNQARPPVERRSFERIMAIINLVMLIALSLFPAIVAIKELNK